MVINAGQCQYAAGDRRSGGTTSTIFKKRRRIPLTSKDLKHFAASCGTAALVFAGILVVGSGLTAKPQSVDTRSDKRLEGTWRVQLTVRDCQTGAALRTLPALFTFAKGGTLSVTTAGQLPPLSTTGLGVRLPTDRPPYQASSERFLFIPARRWPHPH